MEAHYFIVTGDYYYFSVPNSNSNRMTNFYKRIKLYFNNT